MIQGRASVQQIPAATPFKPAAQLQQELGLAELLRLGANENPLGPSPKAVAAITATAPEAHFYPDAGNTALRRRLSADLGFPMDQIVVEAGISGLLRVAAEAFLEAGEKVIYPWPTFAAYPNIVLVSGGVPVAVPSLPDLRPDWDALVAAAQDARMVWLCSPNNPTGLSFGLKELRAFVDRLPPDRLVVVDEAYYEYSDNESALPLVAEGRPVIVMRTFSKVYGIAGLRVGYAVMRPDLADWFNRCREPFQVTNLSQAAALGALDDPEHVALSVAVAREGREYLAEQCRALKVEAIPSDANFVLLHLGFDCRALAGALLRRGVMVRATDDIFALPGFLRVTVGTREMNERFVSAFAELLPQFR